MDRLISQLYFADGLTTELILMQMEKDTSKRGTEIMKDAAPIDHGEQTGSSSDCVLEAIQEIN